MFRTSSSLSGITMTLERHTRYKVTMQVQLMFKWATMSFPYSPNGSKQLQVLATLFLVCWFSNTVAS